MDAKYLKDPKILFFKYSDKNKFFKMFSHLNQVGALDE